MKRLLLPLALGVALGANAQWSENFNSGIPSTWTMTKVDNNIPSANLNSSIVSHLSTQAWMAWPITVTDSCALTVSYFSPAGKADRWLITPPITVNDPNMVLYWDDYAVDNTFTDSLQVLVSPTNSTTTSTFTATLYNDKGSLDNFSKKGVSLGNYNGQTVRVAFRNNNNDNYVLMLDNVGTAVVSARDASVDSVIFPKLLSGNSPVKVIVSNQGATTLTSLTLTYSVDNGSPISQTFTGLNILPYGSTTLQFTTGVNSAATGPHTLGVDLTQSNGTADPIASNNNKTMSFSVANSTVTRNGLIEEFTSSTCVPCAAFNVNFDPLIIANNANDPTSHFNIIKYQMNWPAPGNDVSYNNDGLLRRIYYGVNAIPDHYTNGQPGGNGDQAEITASKTAPAFATISGTYTIKGDSLIASVTVTPTFTLNNANFKLYLGATEMHYTNNGATTTQLQYYHVMRKMLPDGNGIVINNFANGVPQTFVQKYKYTVGTVTQMSNTFWGSPFAGNLVAFLQDPSSNNIVQSVSIPAQWPTAINDVNGGLGNVIVYPNPAREGANVTFTTDKAVSVNVNVVDATGKVVYTMNEKMNTGAQHVFVPTANFAAGIYNVTIATEGGQLTQRLTVIK